MFYIFLLISCLTWLCASTVTLPIVDEEVMKPQDGQICGFGDMNKDRYTDLIVRNHFEVTIMLQTENGQFNPSQFKPIPVRHAGHTVCAVADFNGDAMPDIMITYDSPDGQSMTSIIFFNEGNSFREQTMGMNFIQPPSVVDINGDGIADLVGFKPNSDNQFVCLRGDKNQSMVACDQNTFPGNETIKDPYLKFPHIFADITGDLSSEIIFALTTETGGLRFEVWQQTDDGIWNHNASITPDIPSDGLNTENLGGGTVADFDGDGLIDILVPVCREKACRHVEKILIFSAKSGWVYFQLDLKDSQLVVDSDDFTGGTVFRVGDFTLDGYPDLIAVASKTNGRVLPVIFENVEYSGNTNFSRKFEMMVSPKTPQLIIPPEMSNSRVQMATFFDLKEDGNLDILVEYTVSSSVRYDFIKCDDKGDTTFLKAQIFSNVCTRYCKNSTPSEIGSGIPWHGACAAFTMPDTSGNTRMSLQCQLPQTSQRALHSPYLLFGLGRSPNFIDEVRLGSPRVHDSRGNQQSALKQIVPNSRIFVVPPEGDGIHWQSRLYITPSQLIIQSVAVLISVCIILIVLIFVLHYRERQQDRRERQAQLHRFHFDAM